MKEQTLKKMAKPMILLATLIWGSTFFILKDTLDNVDLQFLLAFRFTAASAVLALVFWRRWRNASAAYWWRGAVLGVLMYAAYTVQNYGLMDTTPGKNAFFTAVYCVIVPFLYWIIDRRRPSRWNVLAALLCVAGIGLVSWDGGFSLTRGDLLTLLCGFLYACHIAAVPKFAQGRDIFLLTVIQFMVSALCSWAGALFTRGIPVGAALPGRRRHSPGPAVSKRGAEVYGPLLRRPAAQSGGPLRRGLLGAVRGGAARPPDVPGVLPDFFRRGVLGDPAQVSAAARKNVKRGGASPPRGVPPPGGYQMCFSSQASTSPYTSPRLISLSISCRPPG